MCHCWWAHRGQILSSVFLDRGVTQTLSIISLNIDGATSKLERRECVELFNEHDIVFLCELKVTTLSQSQAFTVFAV